MFSKTKFTDLLVEACSLDEAVTDNVNLGSAISDTEEIMDKIPEVDSDDVDDLQKSVNVENVRIVYSDKTDKYYIEAVELERLAESYNISLLEAADAILNHYQDTCSICKSNFVVTIPDGDFQQTIHEAEEGDKGAMKRLRDGSDLLRNVINKGLPVQKLPKIGI